MKQSVFSRLLGILLVLLVGLLISSCSKSTPAVAPNQTHRTTVSTFKVHSTTTVTESTTSSTLATSSSVQVCNDMTASVQSPMVSAGTIVELVYLKNIASYPCTIDGYVNMELQNSSGSLLKVSNIDTPVYKSSQYPQSIYLPKNDTVSFYFSYSDVPVGSSDSCAPSSKALLILPKSSQTVVVPLNIAPCNYGQIKISPIFYA